MAQILYYCDNTVDPHFSIGRKSRIKRRQELKKLTILFTVLNYLQTLLHIEDKVNQNHYVTLSVSL